MKKLRIGVIFGGRSVEHEVSLISARAVTRHLDGSKYEVVPIAISRAGRWLTDGATRRLLDEGIGESTGTPVALPADPSVRSLIPVSATGRAEAPQGIDVVFPLVHGTGGEDGTLQGLLEMAGIPYVGAGVLGSSLGMDKGAMKTVFRAAGLACADFIACSRHRALTRSGDLAHEIDRSFGYPCFVKPANGGSSVGVSKVKSSEGLARALQEAAQYDRRIVIEEAIEGQEVECAVLGNDDPEASVVGEIVPRNEFYDYGAKYLDEGADLIVPARITAAQADEVRAMSVKAFLAIDCAGMARVDFFVRRSDGRVLINEINTIPGFTPISMYPRLWEASGMPFAALVDRLVQLALERHAEREANRTDYAPGQKVPGGR